MMTIQWFENKSFLNFLKQFNLLYTFYVYIIMYRYYIILNQYGKK